MHHQNLSCHPESDYDQEPNGALHYGTGYVHENECPARRTSRFTMAMTSVKIQMNPFANNAGPDKDQRNLRPYRPRPRFKHNLFLTYLDLNILLRSVSLTSSMGTLLAVL
jgi:hypothetical protein